MSSFEDFPMIDVQKMNDTEVRLFALLFNLIREPNGISFQRFRNIMPRYYHNEDIESDRKKLYRDLNQLKSMGFNIKVLQFGYQSEDYFPYYLEKESIERMLKFNQEELEFLSDSLYEEENSSELISLAQKLFSNQPELFSFPPIAQKKQNTDEVSSILEKLIQSIKDKRPITITYGSDEKERTIEPYRLVRKNTVDFYLIAYDRQKKSLRRFIIPKLNIKKESKEDFISNLKLNDKDLNFHPLGVQSHEETTYKFCISKSFEDHWMHFLQGFPFLKDGDEYSITTTNKQSLFHYFINSSACLESSDANWKKDFYQYLEDWSQTYQLV
ncbi:WYL domain-containing protein [Leptospira sp. 96542]|nr:WYL domain-containing protein [Leptospira sp. 96542]